MGKVIGIIKKLFSFAVEPQRIECCQCGRTIGYILPPPVQLNMTPPAPLLYVCIECEAGQQRPSPDEAPAPQTQNSRRMS